MSMPDADFLYFVCISCSAKLKAKAAKAGKELPCPRCATVMVIPNSPASSPASSTASSPASSPANSPASSPNSAVDRSGDTYGIRAAEKDLRPAIAPHQHSGPVLPVSGNTTISDTATESYAISAADAGRTKTEEPEDGQRKHRGLIQEPSIRPTPPRWPLLQGVLVFLLEPGAIVYWSVLSFLGTSCVSLLAMAIGLSSISSAPTWLASMSLYGITAAVGALLVMVNASCCLTILQESAAGNRAIEDWPGLAIIDYLLETFYIVNSVLISAAIVWFLSYPLAGFGIARDFFVVGCFVMLFPVMLLSMLEAGSCLSPVSLAVYAGMRRSRRSWLVFFIESLILAFGLLIYLELLDFLLYKYSEHITISIVFMTVAMAVGPAVLLEMIYFRLLGRLAWICAEDSRRELAEEAEEEEQENAEVTEIRPAPVDDF